LEQNSKRLEIIKKAQFTGGGGALLGSFTDPRTYGVEFGAKF